MREARPDLRTPGFLLLTVDGQDREAVVTSGREVVRAPLVPVPGPTRRAAVVFLEQTGMVADCGDTREPAGLHVVHADVVAVDGSTRCLGHG